MDFTLKDNVLRFLIKKTIRISFLLTFIMVPLVKAFSFDRFFLNNILGRQLGDYYVVSLMFQHYSLLNIALISLLLAVILVRVAMKFFSSLFNPAFLYSDVFGAKYIDMPPIPEKESVFEFMRQADEAYENGLGRVDADTLSTLGIDKHGNIK